MAQHQIESNWQDDATDKVQLISNKTTISANISTMNWWYQKEKKNVNISFGVELIDFYKP